MKLRAFVIRSLLRIYPPAWRREFAAEFEDLLFRCRLNAALIANVMVSAVRERVAHMLRQTMVERMSNETFAAHYDPLTKTVSAIVLVILATVPLIAMRTGVVAVFLAALSAAVIALSFAFSPRAYKICDGALRVKRLIGDVAFPLDKLRLVRHASASDFQGCVRLWGSGGLFGYYGWFWSKALGRCKWYVTDRKKAVVVADGDQTILVSPDDHDEFIIALQRGVKTTTDVRWPSSSSRAPVLPRAVISVVTAAFLAFIGAMLLYSPGRPETHLGHDSLVIRSRFYGTTVPAGSVDVANVRVVDLRTEPGWKPVLRTNGFGNPFYRAGYFRTANGRTVKLFTTGAERLVLFPPSRSDGVPILLDAAKPDEFAARVREQWRGQ